MIAIYKKELRAYFNSMIGWMFLAFFFLGIGFYHATINLLQGYGLLTYALTSVTIIIILIIPIFTMRIMAEEGRQKTDQLLYTSPVSIVQIVLGKFFAMATIFAIGVAVLALYPLTMMPYGDVVFVQEYVSLAGFFLMGCVYMAIGMFISSLTTSQILAAVITIGVFLFSFFSGSVADLFESDNATAMKFMVVLWLMVSLIAYLLMKNFFVAAVIWVVGEAALLLVYKLKTELFDGLINKVFASLSITDHFNSFSYGILSVADVVYFITVTALFLFFTVQVINKKRWS